MDCNGLWAESVYIGGGTPTSLEEADFRSLVEKVAESFVSDKTREFTVEAGRPDTITRDKLRAIRECGAGRISVNPQSMKQRTLELIGRLHGTEEIPRAFAMAREEGIELINMDLITGLPEESPEDFSNTLDRILELDPENITVHTLAVKRASRLIEQDSAFSYKQAGTVREMLRTASERLTAASYEPYYLYRQKQMAGNFENVGWAKPGTAGIYNVRIMEEDQTILAFGAGAISKFVDPDEPDSRKKIVRAANVSDLRSYMERIDEMIKRKEEQLI